MQELLGRIARLDPSASLGLRVIACFDELVVGNVGTRALLAAAASLSGCPAGFRQDHPPRILRVSARGEVLPGDGPPGVPGHRRVSADGLCVWLEREGPDLPNDAIVLERLSLAVRIRHGRARDGTEGRRHLGRLVDEEAPVEERLDAAGALGLVAGTRYRVALAPLFAVWTHHPSGPEDVVPTRHGPLHALVVAETGPDDDTVRASPAGVGVATTPADLHHSFRTALVALRLCDPPRVPLVHADEYGDVVGLLADSSGAHAHPDADRLDEIATHPWGSETVEAVVRAQSVRQAARAVGVHHSTMQTRVDTIARVMGFDPFEGLGRSRLGTAHLVWRLRRSTALDLPAPAASQARVTSSR